MELMFKKLISLSLFAALILGCGSKDPLPDEGGNTTPPTEEGTPSTPEKPEEPEQPEEPENPSTPKEEVDANENFTKEGSRGNVILYNDGSAKITAGGNDTYSPCVKLNKKVKSFDLTIKIKKNNLYAFSNGHLILEGKGPDGISYQFRFGKVTDNFSTEGAYTPDKTYSDSNPTYNMNGLDASFSSENITIPTDIDGDMNLRFKIGPYTPSDGGPVRIFAQAWLNDEQILNLWDCRECPWFEGSEYEGCELSFGVNNAQGAFTIEGIEWVEQTELAQMETASKHILWDRFEQSNSVPEPDYWGYIKSGGAAWQYYCSGDPKHAYVEDGVLKLWVVSEGGKFKAGAIDTQYKRAFKNCSVEIRAKWPQKENPSVGRALWFMPQTGFQTYNGWPHGGEIDLLEHNYGDKYVRQTLHTIYIHNGNDCTDSSNPTAGRVKWVDWPGDDWHTYRCDLTGDDVIFYVNGQETSRYSNKKLANEAEVMQWPFAAPYYIILSIGGAGPIASTPVAEDLPAWMEVDYVKVTAL